MVVCAARQRWRRSRIALDETGAVAVEFVLVLPMMLVLIVLAIEFSMFWWERMTVSTATFDATRAVASGHTPAEGYALYNQLAGGLGGSRADGGFSLAVQPGLRSVRSRTNVTWHWPFGLPALLSANPEVQLKASAFFRLEEFWPGPPGKFE
jgi:Flp pilus assembly protein TadG